MRWFLSIALCIPPWAQTAPFTPPEDLSFRCANIMSEGTRMSAEVFALKAAAGKKLPAILMAHGWGGTAALLRQDTMASRAPAIWWRLSTTAAGAIAIRA